MMGVWQLFLVLMIIFALFGAGKLPSVMGDIGKGLRNLRNSLREDKGKAIEPKKDAKDIEPE